MLLEEWFSPGVVVISGTFSLGGCSFFRFCGAFRDISIPRQQFLPVLWRFPVHFHSLATVSPSFVALIGTNLYTATKNVLRLSRRTLDCGRIYKPSSVLQTGARRHPKKLLSFICRSLPPSNGRATLNCWYTWPCRMQ